jgi:hypothetical protein
VRAAAITAPAGGWSWLSSPYDRDIFGLALPALFALVLDPLMSAVDAGMCPCCESQGRRPLAYLTHTLPTLRSHCWPPGHSEPGRCQLRIADHFL